MARGSTQATGVVVGGSVGGALAVVLAWGFQQFLAIELAPNVAAAMATLLIALFGWIGSTIRR